MKTQFKTAKVGMTVLIVLSIIVGIALADPPSGGDAGNTYSTARTITVHSGHYHLFDDGLLDDGDSSTGNYRDKDWYKFSATVGDELYYELDMASWLGDVDMEIHTNYDGHIISEADYDNQDGYFHPVTLDSTIPRVKIYDTGGPDGTGDAFKEIYSFIIGRNVPQL